jgi:hypothetical protein
MVGLRSELKVIAGAGRTEKIALSLVHASGRIDVPVGAINSIEAHEYSPYGKRTIPMPYVEVKLRYDIRVRLRRLTHGLVGERMDIVVDGKCVSRPIVREQLGDLKISTFDLNEAKELAEKMRSRCGISRTRLAP